MSYDHAFATSDPKNCNHCRHSEPYRIDDKFSRVQRCCKCFDVWMPVGDYYGRLGEFNKEEPVRRKHSKNYVLDFDGVIHQYVRKWAGADLIPDPPVPGALDHLRAAVKRFNVSIFSTRNHQFGGVAAMKDWLRNWGLEDAVINQIDFPVNKPPAHIFLDDRAIRFEGTFPDLDLVDIIRPWNKPATYPEEM